MDHHLIISEAAAKRIVELVEKKENPALMFRITVAGGGCSGFQYFFQLDEELCAEDVVFEKDGAKVVVDEISLGLLENATLTFKEDLMGAAFALENPNAASSCGCGNSFSV